MNYTHSLTEIDQHLRKYRVFQQNRPKAVLNSLFLQAAVKRRKAVIAVAIQAKSEGAQLQGIRH